MSTSPPRTGFGELVCPACASALARGKLLRRSESGSKARRCSASVRTFVMVITAFAFLLLNNDCINSGGSYVLLCSGCRNTSCPDVDCHRLCPEFPGHTCVSAKPFSEGRDLRRICLVSAEWMG